MMLPILLIKRTGTVLQLPDVISDSVFEMKFNVLGIV